MLKNKRRVLRDAVLSVAVLAAVFALAVLLQIFFDADKLVPMLFVLGAFIVSLHTSGYFWGIAASLLGVLAVNYAFMFPYYAIDLITPVNLATALVMLIVSVMTSTLTKQISIQQEIKANAERERMRANLLRAVSHDLRTPLTSIYGTCSLIVENFDSIEKEKQLELMDGMRKDADWLIRMVENLLSVTRLDDKTRMVTKVPTVLEELIDSVLVKFYKHYPEQNVEVQIPDEFLSIPMDAMLIEQVLINLLENAVVHAKGMTKVRLDVTVENGSKACFCVSDDGCGIAKEKMSGLLTGCSDREQDGSDGKRTGMGIGLLVCATIIKAHGGQIQAYNLPEGGAAFSFVLDMEEQNEQ